MLPLLETAMIAYAYNSTLLNLEDSTSTSKGKKSVTNDNE